METHSNYRRIWQTAWPIILANCTVPLLGLVDTAVIGHTGGTTDLGAIALGALIFSFVYWSFGFLRMGTTGFVARADGAGDEAEIRATLGRALLFAGAMGIVLIVLQWPIAAVSLHLLSASETVENTTRDYVLIRLWGAPASLAMFVLLGVLVGLGHSTRLLKVQLFLNGLNILLDLVFAGWLGWGVKGIAWGTLLAEWAALCYAAFSVIHLLKKRCHKNETFWDLDKIKDINKLKQTLHANTDILIRTLALLLGFAWFINQGARFGDTLLAANHVLLQFISFSAFFLDGFAFATESIAGRAAGAGNRQAFDQAVRRSTILAGVTAFILSVGVLALGSLFINALTDIDTVRQTAMAHLGWACIYILVSFAAFQLDGIFIGTSQTRDMRNASVFATSAFILLSLWLSSYWLNTGLWLAFIGFVIIRAVALLWHLPKLRNRIEHDNKVTTS